MPKQNRDEVWLVDLGMVAKVRPCLIISIPARLEDRASESVGWVERNTKNQVYLATETREFQGGLKPSGFRVKPNALPRSSW